MKMRASLIPAVLFVLFGNHFAQSQDESLYKMSSEIDTTRENLYFASWQYSFIGDYRKALSSFDKAGENTASKKAKKLPAGLRPTAAVAYIVKRSLASQIVIINEAHHQPLHRVFTESLLDGLYQNGFRYVALEALAEDSLINIRKYPLQSDGYYTSEPQFGNLLRKALRLGYTVVGYEAEGSGSVREKGQAANINKILKRDPAAKILIHCGFSHVVEGPVPSWGKTMAGELKALTGIDPLTVDQVDLTEYGSPSYESEYYIPGSIKEASIFLNAAGKAVKLANHEVMTDLQVMHPRSRFEAGRPTWLKRENFRTFGLKDLLVEAKFPVLVAAYTQNEEKESVPIDQVEIANANEKVLLLPAGKYILTLTDADRKISEARITVE